LNDNTYFEGNGTMLLLLLRDTNNNGVLTLYVFGDSKLAIRWMRGEN